MHGCLRPALRWVQWPSFQDRFITSRWAGVFLREDVIPPGITPVPLWRLKTRAFCDPYTFVGRRLYWFGRFNELHLDNYLRRQLKLGDTFIDIGCNLGQVSTLAATLVGPTGQVIGFDVQAHWARRVTDSLHEQGLTHATIHPFGISDQPAKVFLDRSDKIITDGGVAIADDAKALDRHGEVRVGDEVLPQTMTGRVLVKIDVEGHEPRVLRGIARTMRNLVDHAIIEITPAWIGGETGVAQLLNLMKSYGFDGYAVDEQGQRGPAVTATDLAQAPQTEVVFIKSSPTPTPASA
jgi:FkbM family methyltransferase